MHKLKNRIIFRQFNVVKWLLLNVIRRHFKGYHFNVISGPRPANLKDHRIRLRVTSGDDSRVECVTSDDEDRSEVTRLLRCARNDICCLGRSMIEMLGVLAIIGVLSVGGIAGYSKAMRMWKANVQKQMIVSLLRSMIEVRGKFFVKDYNIEVTPILAAMGYTPEGATFDGTYFIDKNGNKMKVVFGLFKYYNDDGSLGNTDFLYALHFYPYTNKSTILDPSLQDYCISLVEAAKSLGNEYLYTSYGINGENGRMYDLYTYATLQKATLNDIYQKCKITFGEKQTGFSHFTTHIKP